MDGKTTVAASLAISIARSINESSILVDCDLRRPSLGKLFRMESAHIGLREYLEGRASLATTLVKTSVDKLHLMMAGSVPPNPSELISSQRMQLLVEELRGRQDNCYVVLDAPPIHLMPEMVFLRSIVDGVLLVIRSGKTPKPLVLEAMDAIGKGKLLGVVFNGCDEIFKSYSLYYDSYYRKKSS